MAKRTRSRPAYAKVLGAVLIALAFLFGVSLVPHQTAAIPRLLAVRLGQGFGAGVDVVPFLCLLLGVIFFVRERLRLSARVWGMVVGFLAILLCLHLRYPAGHEFLAASGRKGGGYVGALLASALRRSVGEPGLWVIALLALGSSGLLLAEVSLTAALRALGSGLRMAGRWLAGLGVGLAGASMDAAVTLGRRGTQIAWRTLRACSISLRDGVTRCSAAVSAMAVRSIAQVLRPGGLLAPEAPARGTGSDFDHSTDINDAREVPDAHAGDVELESPDAAADEAWAAANEPGSVVDVAGAAADLPSGRTASGAVRRRRPRAEQEPLPLQTASSHAYILPDYGLLDASPAKSRNGKVDPEDVARSLEKTLASFGVDAKVVRWEAGPVVTRYELQPAPGVKVQRITSLQNDIALALAASSVRLEAPIPGKSAIGVELPNERPSLVHLSEILASDEFRRSESPLAVAVGKGIAGSPIVADLVAMPHLLIAGATGAGKSVTINSMIASVLFRATPEQVRFLMIDPKRVELTNYNGIPEMESRYEMFAADGVRNIQAFNAQHPDRPLALILIIIDELADLMMVAPADFEEIICRLAQMTRATGIHLLVATQRPSVDVITGLIKANIPSRIAFSVTSQVDSRTILDHPGAEKLLGRGDMLFSPIGASRPTRVQGAFIGDAETERLVQFWRAQGEPAYVESLVRAGGEEITEENAESDALLLDAARLVVRAGYASVSLLQRKMRIGYVRAARLVDQLEEKGIVGPAQGSSPRDVLMGIDELERTVRATGSRAGRAPAATPEES
jgi:DNA segregation ATPase FtsK/SpoIIIE, S-DNA-T family